MISIPHPRALREMAYSVLDGFGDPLRGEWIDDRMRAFHLRRRLTIEEESRVGPAIDCRSSNEAQTRYDAIKVFLPVQMRKLILEEVPTVKL